MGTHKLRRTITFKNWRRHISGKEKWQALVMRKRVDNTERSSDG